MDYLVYCVLQNYAFLWALSGRASRLDARRRRRLASPHDRYNRQLPANAMSAAAGTVLFKFVIYCIYLIYIYIYNTLYIYLYLNINICIFMYTSTVSIRLEYLRDTLGFHPMLINFRWKQFWTEATRKRSWRRGNCIAIQFLPYYCHFSIVYCLVSCGLKSTIESISIYILSVVNETYPEFWNYHRMQMNH